MWRSLVQNDARLTHDQFQFEVTLYSVIFLCRNQRGDVSSFAHFTLTADSRRWRIPKRHDFKYTRKLIGFQCSEKHEIGHQTNLVGKRVPWSWRLLWLRAEAQALEKRQECPCLKYFLSKRPSKPRSLHYCNESGENIINKFYYIFWPTFLNFKIGSWRLSKE